MIKERLPHRGGLSFMSERLAIWKMRSNRRQFGAETTKQGMNRIYFFLIGFMAMIDAGAQYTQTVTPVLDTQFGLIKELRAKTDGAKGSFYLNENWIAAIIYLRDGAFASNKLENIPVKVDLLNQELELNTKAGIRVLETSDIKAFEWVNPASNKLEKYANCSEFTLDGTPLVGFCKVSAGEIKLVRQDYAEVLKADYNVALDVGSREDKIIKKYKLYVMREAKLSPCTRKLFSSITDSEPLIRKFAKEHHLRPSTEESWQSVVDYWNSIK
jgi:hypothetical protein